MITENPAELIGIAAEAKRIKAYHRSNVNININMHVNVNANLNAFHSDTITQNCHRNATFSHKLNTFSSNRH
jgi:hypothetical protein